VGDGVSAGEAATVAVLIAGGLGLAVLVGAAVRTLLQDRHDRRRREAADAERAAWWARHLGEIREPGQDDPRGEA
jgi:hypothetical protein